MNIGHLLGQIGGLVSNNPIAALVGTAVVGGAFSLFGMKVYLFFSPFEKAASFLAPFVYLAARHVGIREESIKDDALEAEVKHDSKRTWAFLGAYWNAGIDGLPKPDAKVVWASLKGDS